MRFAPLVVRLVCSGRVVLPVCLALGLVDYPTAAATLSARRVAKIEPLAWLRAYETPTYKPLLWIFAVFSLFFLISPTY